MQAPVRMPLHPLTQTLLLDILTWHDIVSGTDIISLSLCWAERYRTHVDISGKGNLIHEDLLSKTIDRTVVLKLKTDEFQGQKIINQWNFKVKKGYNSGWLHNNKRSCCRTELRVMGPKNVGRVVKHIHSRQKRTSTHIAKWTPYLPKWRRWCLD